MDLVVPRVLPVLTFIAAHIREAAVTLVCVTAVVASGVIIVLITVCAYSRL